MAGSVHIGTSGWTYDCWRDTVYAAVPQSRRLEKYAELFGAVEVNATFYHLLQRKTFEKWRDQTPDGFRFAVKGSRFITHVRRLVDAADSVRKDRERASALGPKLLAVLWQLPPGLHADAAVLDGFACALAEWPEVRDAIEFRHASWFTDETAGILAERRIAACISDAARWPMWPAVTMDLAYVRLHGHEDTYRSAYGDEALRKWADRVRNWRAEGRDVHVYFDNTDAGAAPFDAMRLREMLRCPVPRRP